MPNTPAPMLWRALPIASHPCGATPRRASPALNNSKGRSATTSASASALPDVEGGDRRKLRNPAAWRPPTKARGPRRSDRRSDSRRWRRRAGTPAPSREWPLRRPCHSRRPARRFAANKLVPDRERQIAPEPGQIRFLVVTVEVGRSPRPVRVETAAQRPFIVLPAIEGAVPGKRVEENTNRRSAIRFNANLNISSSAGRICLYR